MFFIRRFLFCISLGSSVLPFATAATFIPEGNRSFINKNSINANINQTPKVEDKANNESKVIPNITTDKLKTEQPAVKTTSQQKKAINPFITETTISNYTTTPEYIIPVIRQRINNKPVAEKIELAVHQAEIIKPQTNIEEVQTKNNKNLLVNNTQQQTPSIDTIIDNKLKHTLQKTLHNYQNPKIAKLMISQIAKIANSNENYNNEETDKLKFFASIATQDNTDNNDNELTIQHPAEYKVKQINPLEQIAIADTQDDKNKQLKLQQIASHEEGMQKYHTNRFVAEWDGINNMPNFNQKTDNLIKRIKTLPNNIVQTVRDSIKPKAKNVQKVAIKHDITTKRQEENLELTKRTKTHSNQILPPNISQRIYSAANTHLQPAVFDYDVIQNAFKQPNSEQGIENIKSIVSQFGSNIQDEDGNSILMHAINNKQYKLIDFLLLHGANPNLSNNEGFNAVHLAATNNDYNAIYTMLHYATIDCNAQDDKGNTPVMYAAATADVQVIHLLSKHGGNFLAQNKNNTNVVQFALLNPNNEAKDYILEKIQNEKQNLQTKDGATMLYNK